MLNECLKTEVTQSVDLVDCNAQVGDTGMPSADSANLGPKRLAKQRVQRMRRRHNPAFTAPSSRLGWSARML